MGIEQIQFLLQGPEYLMINLVLVLQQPESRTFPCAQLRAQVQVLSIFGKARPIRFQVLICILQPLVIMVEQISKQRIVSSIAPAAKSVNLVNRDQ